MKRRLAQPPGEIIPVSLMAHTAEPSFAPVFERRHHRGQQLAELRAWCDVWVRPPGNAHETCYVRVFETSAAAEAFTVELQKPWMDGRPWAAKLTGGTHSLRRPDGREVFWCGRGKVVPRIEQRGRAFIEGTTTGG